MYWYRHYVSTAACVYFICAIILAWFDDVLDVLFLLNVCYKMNRIYIHHLNMMSYFLYWSGSCSKLWDALLLMLQQISLKWLILPHSAHLAVGHASSGWMAGTTVTTTLLCRHFGMCLQFSANLSGSLSLFLSCQVFCLISTIYNQGLKYLGLSTLGLTHLSYIYIVQVLVSSLLFLPACYCHLTCV